MSKVTDCARALGEAIVASEEYKNMQITENAAMSDPAVAEGMARYMELKNKLSEVMCSPNADAETISTLGREMDEIQQTLSAMPAVDAMTTARQQFSEIMNQVNRILAFINPEKYADLDLQQKNSEMAIGSGKLYGKGLFNDTAISVKNGNFLSEEHTDFIFSVIGEELGFVGCMIVLLLYLWFIYECLRMAGKARDMSGKLICTGMAALVGFQAFTNIAVATGVFPNTGLPLPFISYGVSSLVSLYIGVGLVLNVGLQPSKLEF